MNTSTLVVAELLSPFCGYHYWSGFQSILSVWSEWVGDPADPNDEVLRSLKLPSVIGGTLWDWVCSVGESRFSIMLHPWYVCALCLMQQQSPTVSSPTPSHGYLVAWVRPICSQVCTVSLESSELAEKVPAPRPPGLRQSHHLSQVFFPSLW